MSAPAGTPPRSPQLDIERLMSPLTLLVGAGVIASMGLALMFVVRGEAVLAVASVLTVPTIVVFARAPDWLIPAVAFAIWTNAPVIAVKFHGVPMIAGMAVPLLLCVPVARDLLLERKTVLITPTLLVLLVFLSIQFVGALFSVHPEESMGVFITYATEGLLLYLLVSNAVRTPATLKSFIWALILGGALVGAIAGHQQLTRSFDSNYGGFAQIGGDDHVGPVEPDTQPRLSGPIGEKNRFAQIMAMLIPLALLQGMAAPTRRQAALAWGCLMFISLGCALAFSRGAAVGIFLMILVMIAMGTVRLRYVAIAGVGIAIALMALPKYGERLYSLTKVATALSGNVGVQNADGATRGRVTEMIAAGLIFADHPIIGVGPGMNSHHYVEYARIAGGRAKPKTRESHSLYPGLAADHGILGVAAFTAMLALTFRDLARVRRRWAAQNPELSAIATALILSLVVYLTTSIFLHAAYVRYFWLVMGLAGAASYLQAVPRENDFVRWLWQRMAHPA